MNVEIFDGAPILIIDDDPASLDSLRELLRLRLRAVRIDVCERAYLASGMLPESNYDVIITHVRVLSHPDRRLTISMAVDQHLAPRSRRPFYRPFEPLSFILSVSLTIQKMKLKRRLADLHSQRQQF